MLNFIKKIKSVFVKSVPDTSEANSVDKTDMAKVIKTGVFVGVAAAISSILTTVSPNTFGPYQPIIIMALTLTLDFINKFIKGK